MNEGKVDSFEQFFSFLIHCGWFVVDVLLISLSSDFGRSVVLLCLQQDYHACNMDLKVHYFALTCPPEMATLLVDELLCKSLVKDCTESTFSSSTVILLLNSSNLAFTCWNFSPKLSNLL
jgi:hypothetical protein